MQLCCSPADSAPVVHLSAFAKKHGVVSGGIDVFIFTCEKTTTFYFELLGAASAPFRVTQVVSRSSSILGGLVGHNKNSFLGVASDIFQCVRARFVKFCGNVISHGLQSIFCVVECCVDIFCVDGFGHFYASKRKNIDGLCTHFFFCLIGVVLATILVTTLACGRLP